MRLDDESGQTIISGMGELHLDIYVERMKREYKTEVDVGEPRVNYRECITVGAGGHSTNARRTPDAGRRTPDASTASFTHSPRFRLLLLFELGP